MNYSDYQITVPNGRTSGEVATQCPKCSHDRKKTNLKPLSVNLDKGCWKCNHCGWVGGLPKNDYIQSVMPKTYTKPVWKNKTDLSSNLVKWFENRKISQKTLIKCKVTEEKVFMPQVGSERNCIQFNYFKNGELINIKSRDGAKNFKLESGAELIFYNIDSLTNAKEAFIVEGECFHPSAEILTQKGWVSFENYQNEPVAQYTSDRKIEFVNPIAKIKKPYMGNLLEFSNSQKFYSLTTPNHDLVVNHYQTGELKKVKAKDIKTHGTIPRVSIHDGNGINLSNDEIRLCIAVSADFTIRKQGDLYACFKKDRKKERISEILNNLKIPFSCRKDNRNYWSIFISRKHAPEYVFKLFPMEWIYQSTLLQKRLIIDEILYWDGNSVPNREQIEYSSKEIHNATFIQTIAHLSGFCSTIIRRNNEIGEWFKVSILFKKTTSSCQFMAKGKKEIPYNGDVYCVTVPSGMLLIRQKECISISGNCDVLTLIECGIQREGVAVIGVPNGANLNKNNLQYVDNCIDLFDSIEKIYIGTDNDIAGRKLREDLAERFGKERCYYIDYKDKKDSNEVLVAYGIQGVIECCSDKKEFPLEGVFTISHFSDEIDDMYVNGMDRGCALGMGRIDELIRFAKGYITVITGVPNHGKSDALDQIILKLMVNHDWRVGFYSPENRPTKLHFSKLARKLIGKNWFGANKMTEAEKNLVKTYLEGKVWFIKPEKEFTIESILNHAKLLKMRKGIDCFVIDAWNRLEHKFGKGNETTYINETLLKIDGFCELNNMHCFLVVHPSKQQKDKKTGQIEVPNLYSLSGSAHFYNIIANGITVYRDFVRDVTTWYVQKVKFAHWGEIGYVDFKYDKECGRYNQYVIDPNVKYTEDKSNWITAEQKQVVMELPKEETGIVMNNIEEMPF